MSNGKLPAYFQRYFDENQKYLDEKFDHIGDKINDVKKDVCGIQKEVKGVKVELKKMNGSVASLETYRQQSIKIQETWLPDYKKTRDKVNRTSLIVKILAVIIGVVALLSAKNIGSGIAQVIAAVAAAL